MTLPPNSMIIELLCSTMIMSFLMGSQLDRKNLSGPKPLVVWGATGALAVGAGLAGVAYAVRGRSSQVFAPSVYRGTVRRRSIALTFDDGPSDGSLSLLEYLAAEGVQATFFQCGINVRRNPRIARAIYEAGHEIGNHTNSHARLSPRLGWQTNWRSPEFIAREISLAQAAIEDTVGVTPRLFRAPYGLRWHGLRAAQKQFGLLGVMWTVIGHDWEWPAEQVVKLVLRKAGPGGIICLHDGRDIQAKPDIGEMLKSVRQIVPALKADGYRFETVSDLLRE